jgi:hypothetical protein
MEPLCSVFGKLEWSGSIFVWLQSELEQSGSILCLVEESRENEPVHKDRRARQERVRSGAAPSVRFFGAGSFSI